MVKFVLQCNCGSTDFNYEGTTFFCSKCDKPTCEDEAGFNLVEEVDEE